MSVTDIPNISVDAIERARLEVDFMYFIEKAWPHVDPSAEYKFGWHIKAIAEHLELCREGKIRNLLINVPPRTGKSTIVSVLFHAWWWATEPNIQFLGASYNTDLSVRDAVRARVLMLSDWYKSHWNDWSFSQDQNQKHNYTNDRHGRRQSTSVDGVLTGLGGRVLLLDDPHNASESESEVLTQRVINWYREGFQTRANDPKNAIKIVIMQRLSEKDLSGFILQHYKGDFDHLCLPMYWSEDTHCVNSRIGYEDPRKALVEKSPNEESKRLLWPEHIDLVSYHTMRRAYGEYGAAGQLDQRPAPRGGGLLKPTYFSVSPLPPKRIKRCVRAWDTAGSSGVASDYSVGVKVAEAYDGHYYILDIIRVKEKSSDVLDRMYRTAIGDGQNVDVIFEQEPGASGKMTAELTRKRLSGFRAQAKYFNKDKITRFMPCLPIIESGKVRLVAGNWNNDFLQEIGVWPGGRHDDQVDAFGMALSHIATYRPILVA